jgi:hypothetical protein
MTGMRYDFDPHGRAQSYGEDWEREFAASSLRAQAREARKAQRIKAREGTTNDGLWVRFTRRARLVRGSTLRFRPVH